MGDAPTIDTDLAPEPRADAVTELLDDEATVYDDTNGRVHVLNQSATAVWQLLDGRTPIGDIARAIAETTGASLDRVAGDVVALVRMLAELGVLVGFEAAAVEPPSP